MSFKHIFGAKSFQDLIFRLNFDESEAGVRRFIDPTGAVATLMQPDYSRVWGFDCSHWNGVVNMATAKSNGARFVLIKAADGTIGSRYFPENWLGAKAAGIPRGAYCWIYPHSRVSCITQARAWWDAVKADPGELPLVVDFEWTVYAGQSANPDLTDLDIAVTEFNRLSPRKPILYTAPGYVSQFGRIPEALRDKFTGLWIAHWDTFLPSVPASFQGWLFHQYGASLDGQIVGYNPLVARAADLDYCKSENVLASLTGAVPEPPAQPPQPEPGGSMNSVTYTNAVVIQSGRLNGHSDYEVKIVPPGAIDRANMFAPKGCRLVDTIDGDIVFNFAPFDLPCQPNLGVRVNGREYQVYDGIQPGSYAPFFWWDDQGRLMIDHRKTVWRDRMSALQGFRYLIEDGAKNPRFNADWDNREPRRVIGRLPDGSTVLLSICGRGYRDSLGATLHECVDDILLPLGCDYAIDGDSGGSTRDIMRLADGTWMLFQGTDENRGVPSGGVIKLREPLAPVDSDPTTPPPDPGAITWPDFLTAHQGNEQKEYYPK